MLAGQCQVVCGPSVSTDLINVPKRLPCPAVWLLIFAQGVAQLKEWQLKPGSNRLNIATGAARSVAEVLVIAGTSPVSDWSTENGKLREYPDSADKTKFATIDSADGVDS